MVIEVLHQQQEQARAITFEEYHKRRIQRRRRVAKRMLKAIPLFAVEMMQSEFPGYTYDEFVADVTRKTRKGKSLRKPKRKSFDWNRLRADIPDFFEKCIARTPSKATLRFKIKDHEFLCTIQKVYDNEMSQCILDEWLLVKLWRGTLKDFLNHPSVWYKEMKENKIDHGMGIGP